MIRVIGPISLLVMEVEPTPEERARALDDAARYRKNLRRYEQLAPEIGEHHRGKFICIAGEELLVGDDPLELHARARAAHPEDAEAFFSKFVPTHRGPKIYANQRRMGTG